MAMPEKTNFSRCHRKNARNPRKRKNTKHITQKAEGGISEENVIAAIRATGTGKSPGPDGLPSEVYRTYEDIIAPILAETLRNSHEEGTLPETMLNGDVALIYKKRIQKTLEITDL